MNKTRIQSVFAAVNLWLAAAKNTMRTIRIVEGMRDGIEALLAIGLAPRVTHPRARYTVREPNEPNDLSVAAVWTRRRRPASPPTPSGAGKLALQAAVLLAATVPVTAGAWGVADGFARAPDLASHGRYLSGLLLAIGLAFWTTVPNLERKAGRFRLLTAIVLVGGLARLAGVLIGDALSWPTAGALIMELVVTPLLCLWQGRLVGSKADFVTTTVASANVDDTAACSVVRIQKANR